MNVIVKVPITELLKKINDSADFGVIHSECDLEHLIRRKAGDFDFLALLDSIESDGGIKDPIVIVSDGDWFYLGNGHHRFAAAVLLGLDSIDVVFSNDYLDAISDRHDYLIDSQLSDRDAFMDGRDSNWLYAHLAG